MCDAFICIFVHFNEFIEDIARIDIAKKWKKRHATITKI